ncbi:sensor histidine kinase [Streptomyces winkii]|uniref:sensor histidine kinase n=1 Tax=Streptomyces winkii TaxID=3051178 RepID=UPI0028D34925|nr:histidine kinase [Streptomyces sp. DSM 40971]
MTAKPAAGPLTDVRQWMRAHPYAVDALIALGAFVAIMIGAAADSAGHEISPRFGHREVAPGTALLAALACAVLVLRRRAPMPVLCMTSLVTVVGLVVDPRGGAPDEGHRTPLVIAAIIALYTVSNRTDRVTSVRVGVVTVGVLTAAGMLLGSRPWYAQDNLATFAWSGLAAAAGEAVRSRRAFVDAIRERAERAERTREEEARRRVAEERMRIARELHDVVAHHIALVNVQAGVASHVMDQRPDQAKEALAHVREASRHALNELQATVGLLRQSGESTAPTEPAPGLGVLDELVDGFTRAGLAVTVDMTSESGPAGETAETGQALPSAVDLTAYRVVQEALTNVQKHVGTGAHVQVGIVTRPDALEVTVIDDGDGDGDGEGDGDGDGDPQDEGGGDGGGTSGEAPAATGPFAQPPSAAEPPDGRAPSARAAESGASEPAASETGGGHGLMGMRERAAALHGVCETGPLPDGGFRVHVRLPLQRRDPERDLGRHHGPAARTEGGDGSGGHREPRAEEGASA